MSKTEVLARKIAAVKAKQFFAVPAYFHCGEDRTKALIVEHNGVCTGYCVKCGQYVKNYPPQQIWRAEHPANHTAKLPANEDFAWIATASRREEMGLNTVVLGAADTSDAPEFMDLKRRMPVNVTFRMEPVLIVEKKESVPA